MKNEYEINHINIYKGIPAALEMSDQKYSLLFLINNEKLMCVTEYKSEIFISPKILENKKGIELILSTKYVTKIEEKDYSFDNIMFKDMLFEVKKTIEYDEKRNETFLLYEKIKKYLKDLINSKNK